MKVRLGLLAAALALLLMPATALAQPVVPLLYHGSVTINGVDAPTGTIITAEIDETEVATNAPGGTTQVGSYELDVAAHEGDVVVLKVNGVEGGQTTHPDPMSTFEVVLDLSVGEAPPPPPTLTAEAGGPYSGPVGESITLSGSASGGTSPYTYEWDLDNDGQYDDATGASPSYSWQAAGEYTIGLQVTDDASATATDTATVTIEEVVELTALAGGPYSGTVGEDITLSGSASGGTSPYTYEWDLDNDGQYNDATGASPSHSWDAAGTYTIGLQVTDDASATATDTATVTVTEFDPYVYDTDEDGELSKDETLAAVDDYFAGNISKDEALEVIKLYFS